MREAEFLSLLHDIDHISRVLQGEFDEDSHSIPREVINSLEEASKELHEALAKL